MPDKEEKKEKKENDTYTCDFPDITKKSDEKINNEKKDTKFLYCGE